MIGRFYIQDLGQEPLWYVACALFCPYILLIVHDDSENKVGCVMSDDYVKVFGVDADVRHGCVRGRPCQEAL